MKSRLAPFFQSVLTKPTTSGGGPGEVLPIRADGPEGTAILHGQVVVVEGEHLKPRGRRGLRTNLLREIRIGFQGPQAFAQPGDKRADLKAFSVPFVVVRSV